MRRITKLLAAATMAAGIAGAGMAAPAQASSLGNVYVSLPTWLGSCGTAGGEVNRIWATNDVLWTTPAGGDAGDDLVYPRVRLGGSNTLSFQPFCHRPLYKGGDYRGVPFSVVIRPSRNGQTFWVGPVPQQYHN